MLETLGYGIRALYEDPIDGPAIDPTVPLSAVEEVLETESQDADKSLGFIAYHIPSPRIVDAPRTPLASSPPSPPPLPTFNKKLVEENVLGVDL